MVKMEIYMHPKDYRPGKSTKEGAGTRSSNEQVSCTEIGYGHLKIISLKDLVLKRKTLSAPHVRKDFRFNEIILNPIFRGVDVRKVLLK